MANNSDNTIAVVQQLVNYYRIRVSQETVSNDLTSHAAYPSLKSISDAFTRWRVENYAVEIDRSELLELSDPFLAHVKNEDQTEHLFIVYEVSETAVVYAETLGKRRAMKLAEFLAKWDGIVLMVNPPEEAGEKDYIEKRQHERIKNSLLPLGIAAYTCLVGCFLADAVLTGGTFSLVWWGLLTTYIAGIVLSVLAIRIERGQQSGVIDKLCRFGKQNDCKAIINDEAAHVYGWISLADAGLVYFLASLMAMLTLMGNTNSSPAALAWFSIFTIPVCGYSIYYQWVVAKKWCPVCLGIVTVLLIAFILLYPYITFLIPFGDLAVIGLSFLSITTYLLTYRAFARADAAAGNTTSSFLKLKRDPLLFEYLLTRNERKDLTVGPHSFIVGNPQAPATITAFLSLTCNPCKRAFAQVDEVLSSSTDYNLDVVLSVRDVALFDQFYYVYKHQGPETFLDALRSWYLSNGEVNLTAKYRVPAGYSDPDQAHKTHIASFMQAEIEHTPTIFVQGYKLPKSYQVEDLAYVHPAAQSSTSN